jgi:hypothetical protein
MVGRERLTSRTTPPGTSDYTMYRDESLDPPAIVCQVGSTKLLYHLQAIDALKPADGGTTGCGRSRNQRVNCSCSTSMYSVRNPASQ